MSLINRALAGFRNLTVCDIALFKLCLIAFTLMIAKLLPVVLVLEWYWYGIVFAVTYVLILKKMFKKQES